MKYIFSGVISLLIMFMVLFIYSKYNVLNLKIEKFIPLSKSDDKIHETYMESSPFVWNGKLKYLLSERDDKKKYYKLSIYDFETRKKEMDVADGYGLASAIVIDNILYITATKDWFNYGKSEVHLISSSDLRHFSKPKSILKSEKDQKIYNTSMIKNDSNGDYILVYEFEDSNSRPFSFSFLISKDGEKWQKYGDTIFGKETYVGCPSIKYIDNYYYLWFMVNDFNDPNCIECISYITKISRSKDLKKWETSQVPFLYPSRGNEGNNNSDVDLVEYRNGTFILYAIGDQVKNGGIKYVHSDLPINKLVLQYFE